MDCKRSVKFLTPPNRHGGAFPLGTSANGVHSDRRVEAWGAFMTPSVIRCAPIAEHDMALVKWNSAIDYVKGALSKPKKQDGHMHGDYLIGTHREAPTTNPNCTRAYVKEADAYKRSTPVTSDETLARQRFGAIVRAVAVRRKNLSTIAADTAAFNAQKETGYKTLYQYLWHVCAEDYDKSLS